ncbi:hypothetical protein [Natrialba asiatica]|uniref:Uncharacterized protein n=1 Tax=Natrialba asiatica (strain ATCC 700177 / DSM 12278 / JCM 9576 / FERM P-10747 / NBRC 102637 / 172P1) TaxID=29540 RepID=M0AEN2_NATA1|nr:hypothetical protein [Natrialba asiatica]ELY97205.1 hypothetical protein C481_20596 [Natrialba asiatica DSM 12278]
MTGFDLGDPADDADEPDEPADERPESSTDQDSSSVKESPTPEPEPEQESEPESDSTRERDPTETGPSFPYSEVRQSPLYARDETWTKFEDQLDFTVTPELRRMGIRDDELREIHDVVLEIALDNIEEIPERLAEKRRDS